MPFDEIKRLAADCIHSFPFTISRNKKNLGSDLTFEQLTHEAEGEYFAYCDQDDVWLPEKLEILQDTIETEKAELVCSDMVIIDENGKQIADSITQIRRSHIFRSGTDLTDTLWYSNFSSGCAMLVRAEMSKKAIPFNPYMFYDHYITLYCANAGAVISIPQKLICHREYGENQSSVLQGVHDKESYRRIRIDEKAEAVYWLEEHFPCDVALKKTLSDGAKWMRARQAYARGEWSQMRVIWKYRDFSRLASLLEIASPLIPERLFRILLWFKQKNYV